MDLQTLEACDPGCNFSAGTCKLAGTCEHINFLAGTCKLAGTCDPATTSWQEPANSRERAITQQMPNRKLQTRRNLLSHSTYPAKTGKLAGTCYQFHLQFSCVTIPLPSQHCDFCHCTLCLCALRHCAFCHCALCHCGLTAPPPFGGGLRHVIT